jgi:hypothetical protein
LEVSVLEEKDPADTSARSESVEDVGRERPEVQRALTSLEITEAALAEERRDAEEAAKKVARQPHQQAPSPVPKTPPEPLPKTLERWGYRPALVAKHRFTERELNLAVEKVEAAKTPLGNRAGAVVATILRWRTGQWQVAA